MRDCSLNPIEIAWARMKNYIRKNNTNFSSTDVYELASEFITSFDGEAAQGVIRYAEKVERTHKAADRFVENNIEPQLIDDISDIGTDIYSDTTDDDTES